MSLSFSIVIVFFFSSRRRHTRYWRDWSSDVCSSDLVACTIVNDSTSAVRGNELKNSFSPGVRVSRVQRIADSASGLNVSSEHKLEAYSSWFPFTTGQPSSFTIAKQGWGSAL